MNRKATFPVIDVIAAAIAAFKDNNREIERSTYQYRENGELKTTQSNRDIALTYLANPETLDPFKQEAADAIEYFQQQAMMSTLLGKTNNSFTNTIADAINNDIVVYGNVGLLVWLPKMLNQLRSREDSRVQWIDHAASSAWVPAKETEKITVEFSLIEKRYLKDKNIWVVTGHTPEGYIISFLSNNEKKIINKGRISGKVKSFLVDRYRNDAKITSLNYVKVLD